MAFGSSTTRGGRKSVISSARDDVFGRAASEAEQKTKKLQRKRKVAYDNRLRLVRLLKVDLALIYESRHARFPRKLHLR